jgi:hypothetical protein
MRKFILLLLFIPIFTKAQEFKLEDKTVTGIFEIKEKTKAEIYASINKWVSINYNSAKNVVQMNDLESGTIIIKGINEVSYKNLMTEVFPKALEYYKTKFNHLIEINIKDNKFRIVYKITDVFIENMVLADVNSTYSQTGFFNCISFDGKNDSTILVYNENMEAQMKKWMIGKEKREKFKSLSKPSFEEISNSLVSDIKSTMQSIEKSIIETQKDNW